MKVLMLGSYFAKGGAGRAALRLAQALPLAGVDVDYRSIYPVHMNLYQKGRYLLRVLHDRLPALLLARKRIMFSSGAPRNPAAVKWINESDADLVHLHWVNGGGLAVADLALINKPIAWTLHDMWGFTGGCHYDAGCMGYQNGCGTCPQLNSTRDQDISYSAALEKSQVYGELDNLTIVGLSRWIAECAANSSALAGLPIRNLPNPIDTHTFRPEDKYAARTRLGLSQTRKIVLFGADAAVSDPRKGYEQLVAALKLLPRNDNPGLELAVFGSVAPEQGDGLGFKSTYFGRVGDEQLRALYSAADVMVVPSLQESFGQTASEAMACGTPVVAFGATGLLDIIDHKVNGYLAAPYRPASLAQGIAWVLSTSNYPQLCSEARKKIVETFASAVVASRYREFYLQCLQAAAALARPGLELPAAAEHSTFDATTFDATKP